MFDLTLLNSGGSRQFDTDKIIQRYDQRISMSILSDFILLGHDRVGSYSLGASKMDLWSMAVDSIAKNIAEVFNQYAVPRLLKLNGMDTSRAPQIAYGSVSHVDLMEIADFVSKLVQSGTIVPDQNLEHYLRDIAGLPVAEHDGAQFGMPPVKGADTTTGEEATPVTTEEEPSVASTLDASGEQLGDSD